MNRHHAIILLLFIIGFLLRLYFVATIDNVAYGTDSAARFMHAKEWYMNPQGIPGRLTWLPVFPLLLVLLAPFGLSCAMSATTVMLVLSSLSIPFFYVVVRKSFNASVAFWSALLLVLNPFHAMYSSWYMTENVFLFFVLLAFYFLLRFLESEKQRHLLLSSLFINMLCLIRYEGWAVALLLPLFLFLKRNDFSLVARYLVLNSFSIITYMTVSYLSHGVLAYGIYMSRQEIQIDLATKPDLLLHIKQQLSAEFVYPKWLYFVVLAGMVYALVKKYRLVYLLTWFMLFSFSAYGIITLTSQPFWRYLSCSLFLLLPFGGLIYSEISGKGKMAFSILLLLTVIFTYPVMKDYYRLRKEYSTAPAEYKAACKILKETKQPGEKVIFQMRIRLYDHDSFLEDVDIERQLVYYPPHDLLKIFDDYQKFSGRKLIQLLQEGSFRYIFVQRGMELDSVLGTPSVNRYLLNSEISFDTLYNEGNYYLLKTRKGNK